jgi:hypothetical protein
MASQRRSGSTRKRSAGRLARLSASANVTSTSRMIPQLPRAKTSSRAEPCSGGTGWTLKRSLGPAVVGSS